MLQTNASKKKKLADKDIPSERRQPTQLSPSGSTVRCIHKVLRESTYVRAEPAKKLPSNTGEPKKNNGHNTTQRKQRDRTQLPAQKRKGCSTLAISAPLTSSSSGSGAETPPSSPPNPHPEVSMTGLTDSASFKA